MKKYIVAILVVLMASLLLWGCCIELPIEGPETPATDPSTEPATQPSTEPATEPSTEPTEAPTTEPTTAPTTEPTTAPTEPEKKNLQEVPYVGAYIFKEPTYDADVVQPMPTGTYTITKEKMDDEGNLWGKLKSGLGWICLTDIRNFDAPLAIGELDPELKKSGNYTEYVISESEYAIPVVIQACRKLSIVDVYSCLLVTDKMAPDQLLESVGSMKKGETVVVWLEFPGDMSTFEIQALYGDGETCRYQVATSGRNATLSVRPVD